METERHGMFMSPEAGSKPVSRLETKTSEKNSISYSDILRMNGDELNVYISAGLASAEEEMFGGPTEAESKLIFLGATRKSNIAKEKTFEGVPIYKNRPKFRKISEIDEFLGVANQVLYEDGKMEDLVSEAADIFYNLTRLTSLDTNNEHMHAPNYEYLMSQIATSLGWDKRQALLITAVKFHSRFVERKEKDPTREKELMEGLLKIDPFVADPKSQIHTPTFAQIDDACDTLDDIKEFTLVARLGQIRADKQRKKDGNGQVAEPWS